MRQQRGFTLVELMIVVAILGILSAIALVQYRNYTVLTAERACLADVKVFATDLIVARSLGQEDPLPQPSTACLELSVDGGIVEGVPAAPGVTLQLIDVRIP